MKFKKTRETTVYFKPSSVGNVGMLVSPVLHQLSDKPRRLLVGGMKARHLLATPLLQWYLKYGLDVSKIYQVVEFQQQRCLQEFVKEVSEARRQGDADPYTAIIVDTMKVIGNSGFGSLIMDKTKH